MNLKILFAVKSRSFELFRVSRSIEASFFLFDSARRGNRGRIQGAKTTFKLTIEEDRSITVLSDTI